MSVIETHARHLLLAWYLLALLRATVGLVLGDWELALWIGVALVLTVLWRRQVRHNRAAGAVLQDCRERLDDQSAAIIRLYAKTVSLRGKRRESADSPVPSL